MYIDEIDYLAGNKGYDKRWAGSIVGKFLQNHARAAEIAWYHFGLSDSILTTLLANGSPLWELYKCIVVRMETAARKKGFQTVKDVLAAEFTIRVCSAKVPNFSSGWYIAIDSALTAARTALTLSEWGLRGVRSTTKEGMHITPELWGDESER